MDAKILIEAAEEAGYPARSYSGRGMFGRECVGIVCPRGEAFSVAAKVAHELLLIAGTEDRADELLGQLARLRASSDSMGRDEIVYFQGVPWPDEEDEEEEEVA